MMLTAHEIRYLLQRREEIRRELRELQRRDFRLAYCDVNERRVELDDELTEIENELRPVVTEATE
jgi:hypothetical protein